MEWIDKGVCMSKYKNVVTHHGDEWGYGYNQGHQDGYDEGHFIGVIKGVALAGTLICFLTLWLVSP